MIVAETADRFRFVTQPSHADLAGQFADRWGNDDVAAPEPDAAMSLAAYAHDTGWQDYDRRPHLADDGRPVDFGEMPADPWIDLYDEGIDAVVGLDAYAGLLVSMHGVGLRNQRYGLSPSWPETPPEYRSFVDRQESLQARLAEELCDEGRLSVSDVELLSVLHESGAVPDVRTHTSADVESRLWDNYTLLQAWDTLSLSFCMTHSPPSYGEISPVPTGDPTTDTLSIEPLGDDAFRIDPYPFDASPLVVSVPARTVPKDSFQDEEELVRAYYRADRELLEFTLRR
jgi:hypothetical protein